MPDRFAISPRIRFIRMSVVLALALPLVGCPGNKPSTGHNLPTAESQQAIVSAFTIGVAGLEAGDDSGPDVKAVSEQKLKEVTQAAPDEPAAWADLGLLYLRQNHFPEATTALQKAHALASNNAPIVVLQGLLADRSGQIADAVKAFRSALALDPGDIKVQYLLAEEIEKQGEGADLSESQKLMQSILAKAPGNLEALLEAARFAAKRGDAATLTSVVDAIGKQQTGWPPVAISQYASLKSAVHSTNVRTAATQVLFLKNTLKQVRQYRESYAVVTTPPNQTGQVIERFLKLANPSATPSAPDTGLSFATQSPGPAGAEKWNWAGTIVPNDKDAPSLIRANGSHVDAGSLGQVSFPGGSKAIPPSGHGVLAIDLNHDYKTDLVLAGAGGLKLYQQSNKGFIDVTAKSRIPATILNAPLWGVWAADLDSDGDFDLVIAPVSGPTIVLRNNGDGTYTPLPLFKDIANLRDFAGADFDGDGASDVALLDGAGKLHIFANRRFGNFVPRPVSAITAKVAAITVGDINADGKVDLVALQTDGGIQRISDKAEGTDWDVTEVALWHDAPAEIKTGGSRLFVADLDNNGALDLIASLPEGSQVWLADEKYQFTLLATQLGLNVGGINDATRDGRLDLIGIGAGQLMQAVNKGTKSYHWQEYRPRASEKGDTPDKIAQNLRINSFGIGGEMEIRAGLLAERVPITDPIVHFGLGEYPQVDVLRIVWPTGVAQTEFQEQKNKQLKGDQMVVADQRLQGSCPFLFAYNGKEMQFVTDCIWRSPLGLRINAQVTAPSGQTEDWLKIRGDQLQPHDGYYDLRITAELRETHFFDLLALQVVDHPVGTDIFVDERFAMTPPAHTVYPTATPRPIAHAWDDNGNDVTDLVRARDGRYVDNFGRGEYQGITRDHWIEIEPGADLPKTGPAWLIANGWLHPTDSSINVAISQGSHEQPRGLSLEVPDGKGHWVVARPGLGFPEGKVKTILLNMEGIFRHGAPRRLRLRTNLEVFWDQIQWAPGLPATPLKINRLAPTQAELQWRGFSFIRQADKSSPELPASYELRTNATQPWRDLIGYYTRYGDVMDLLKAVDDRYVIMNAGDELCLRFPEAPPPPSGWVRDYVVIGDGWEKDGNLNTTFSKTVLPLPAHAVHTYDVPPGLLEDDPVYRRHASDWQTYHTRYVTPDNFQEGLRLRSSK